MAFLLKIVVMKYSFKHIKYTTFSEKIKKRLLQAYFILNIINSDYKNCFDGVQIYIKGASYRKSEKSERIL